MDYDKINKKVQELLSIANCESWIIKPTNNLYVRHNSFKILLYELVNGDFPMFFKEYKTKKNKISYSYHIFWHEDDTLAEKQIMYIDKIVDNLIHKQGDNMKKINKEKLEKLMNSLAKAKLVLANLKEKEDKVKKEEDTPIIRLIKGLEEIAPTNQEWKEKVLTDCDKETFQYLLRNKDSINREFLENVEKALYPAYQMYRRVESFLKRYSGD